MKAIVQKTFNVYVWRSEQTQAAHTACVDACAKALANTAVSRALVLGWLSEENAKLEHARSRQTLENIVSLAMKKAGRKSSAGRPNGTKTSADKMLVALALKLARGDHKRAKAMVLRVYRSL
jgi:hypothetical protein